MTAPADPLEPVGSAPGPVVLVVDDDPLVRSVMCATLERAGLRPISADDAPAALRLLEDPDIALDLLLTDVVMPAIDGRALADRATSARPELPVVFVSAVTEGLLEGVSLSSRRRVLPKPFGARELLVEVRAALDGV